MCPRFSKRQSVRLAGGKNMVVVKCGASGHNIRSKPSLKAAPVGMLALGNTVTILEYVSITIVCEKKKFQAIR